MPDLFSLSLIKRFRQSESTDIELSSFAYA